MKAANIYAFISWIMCTGIISFGLLQHSYMQDILRGDAKESLSSVIIYPIIFGYPWFILTFSNSILHSDTRKIVFSTASIVISFLFSFLIATAPLEGVGIYTILYLIVILVGYPLTNSANNYDKNL